MKDLSRNVTMFCDVCGNDQFSTLDEIKCELGEAQTKQECNVQTVEKFLPRLNCWRSIKKLLMTILKK